MQAVSSWLSAAAGSGGRGEEPGGGDEAPLPGRASLNVSFRQVPHFAVTTPPDSPEQTPKEPGHELPPPPYIVLDEESSSREPAVAAHEAPRVAAHAEPEAATPCATDVLPPPGTATLPTVDNIADMNAEEWERELAALRSWDSLPQTDHQSQPAVAGSKAEVKGIEGDGSRAASNAEVFAIATAVARDSHGRHSDGTAASLAGAGTHGEHSALRTQPLAMPASASTASGGGSVAGAVDGVAQVEGAASKGTVEVDTSEPALPLPIDILEYLQEAFDEDDLQPTTAASSSGSARTSSSLSGFKWTGIMDAAQAAWIGGTHLLKYGELLPGGVSKALHCMLALQGAPDRRACENQLILELGAGRGRLALQLFLMGATVIGVELASERYGLAVAAIERLVHRLPHQFDIVKRTSHVIRLCRRKVPNIVCEIRLGNFLNTVTDEEIGMATLVFCQVCLPAAVHGSIRGFLDKMQTGCRVLMFESMTSVWGKRPCPFRLTSQPRLACSWDSQRGYRFHCYERLERPQSEPPPPAASPSPEQGSQPEADWDSSGEEEESDEDDEGFGGWI